MAERETFAGREAYSERRPVTDEGARARLIDGLSRMRGWTAEGLERARLLATARLATQRRELERLGAKLGGEDPRVAELRRKIALGADTVQVIARHAERAATIVASPDRDRWVVHGQVRDREGRGIAGLTVAVYDERGNWVKDFGYTATDEAGAFRLAGPAREGAAVSVGVRKGTRLVSMDTAVLAPAAGRAEYREIRLDDRATAPPRARRKRKAKKTAKRR